MSSNEIPYTVTIPTGPEAGSPTIQVSASSAQQLELHLQALEVNGTAATLARLVTNFTAQFNVGRILDGKTLAAPVNATVVAQPPEAAVKRAPAPRATIAGRAAAQPASGFFSGSNEEPPAPAGAPILAGIGPARLVDKSDAPRPWKAWVDPRGRDILDGIFNKTTDPNDPGLAAGESKFFLFIND